MRVYKVEECCPNCDKLLNKKHICPKCKKHIPYNQAIIVEIDEDIWGLDDFNNLEELR